MSGKTRVKQEFAINLSIKIFTMAAGLPDEYNEACS
jgi:hypothetical protein